MNWGAKLGSGAFADVITAYPATEIRGADYQNPLALKLFKDDVLRGNMDVFNREAAALSRVGEHPNVIRAVGHGLGGIFKDGDRVPSAYISMEYADGGSVASQAPLPMHQTVRMGYQALSGLVSLHGWGMVHRDIKIENILVTGEPEQPTFKLGDFGGVDGIYRGTPQSRQKDIMATRRGAPSETYERKATERTDIYGLGIALAEAMTNQVAKDKKGRIARLEELAEAAGIPRDRSIQELGRIILKATQDNPLNRYPSALAMQADLSQVLQETQRKANSVWRYKPVGGRQVVEGLSRTKEVTDSLWVPYSSTEIGASGMSMVEELVNGELVPMLRPVGEMRQDPDTQMVSAKTSNTVGDRVSGALDSAWESMQSWAGRRFHKRQVASPVERGQPADYDMLPMAWLQGSMADKLSSVQARAERRYNQRETSVPLEYDASVKDWRVRFNNKPLPNIAGVFKSVRATAGRWIDGRLDRLEAWSEKMEAAKAAAQLKIEEEKRRELDDARRSMPPVSPPRSAPEMWYVRQEVRRVAASSASNGGNVSIENDSFQGESDSSKSKPELGRRHFMILGALAAAAGGGVLGKEVYERLNASDVSDTVFALDEFIPKEDRAAFQISTAQAFMDKYEPFYALRMIGNLEEKGMIDEAAVAAQRFADDDPLSARRTLYNLRDKTNDRHVLSRFDDYRAVLALHNPEIVQKLQEKYKPGHHMREFYQVALDPERSHKNRSVLQEYVAANNYWHPKQLAPVLAARNPELLLGFANDIAKSKAVYRGDKGRSDSAFALLNTIAEEFIPNNPVAADKLMRKIENIVQKDNDTQYPLRLALRFAAFYPQTAYNALERYRSYGDAWKGSGDILRIALAPHFDGIKSPEGAVGKAWFAYASDPRDKALKAQAMEALRGSKNVATNAHWLALALLRGQTARYK